MDSTDSFETLDIDKLEVLIRVLKDNEIPYFRIGSMEIGTTQPEPEPSVGFVPLAQRAGAKAEKSADEAPESHDGVPARYRKAFGNRPIPTLKPKG